MFDDYERPENEYRPTEQDHTWGDLRDRLEAGFTYELARSREVIEEAGLQTIADLLPAALKSVLGEAWSIYSHQAHGTGGRRGDTRPTDS